MLIKKTCSWARRLKAEGIYKIRSVEKLAGKGKREKQTTLERRNLPKTRDLGKIPENPAKMRKI